MKNDIQNEGVIPSHTLKIWDTTPKAKVVGSHGTVADHVHRSHYFQLFFNRWTTEKTPDILFGPASSGGRGLPQDARNLAAGSYIGTR